VEKSRDRAKPSKQPWKGLDPHLEFGSCPPPPLPSLLRTCLSQRAVAERAAAGSIYSLWKALEEVTEVAKRSQRVVVSNV
jgi:hypothetical protein